MKINKITARLVSSLIKPRNKNAHKNDFGHVLVIAGSKTMSGAAVLAAGGALRAGAGLVTAAVPAEIFDATARRIMPEAMIAQRSGFESLRKYISKRKISSIALGPGLGLNESAKSLVLKILKYIDLPVVLDADAISCVAKTARTGIVFPVLKKARAKLVLTPHAGEFSRLTGFSTAEIAKNRAALAKDFAEKNNVTLVLKGNASLVTDGKIVRVNTTGNPGMATAGAGDVLTGIIAALIKQVKEPLLPNAAAAGVFLHGLAGDIAAREKTELALTAGDIAEAFPRAARKV